MSTLLEDFDKFESSLELSQRKKKIDYDKYIEALNVYAAEVLGLDGKYDYVILKPVYLHGTKIHSLIFNECKDGKRYSARLKRRLSLGMRDRGENWIAILKKAHGIAMESPPVGLDPKLEELKYWKASNKNYLRMTFVKNDTEVIVNAKGVISAHGDKADMLDIIQDLIERGL